MIHSKYIHPSLYIFPTVIILLYFLSNSSDLLHSDFGNNYFGARLLANGSLEKTIYQPYYFNSKILTLWNITIFANYTPNTPFISILFLPLTYLDYFQAKLLFNIFSIIFFCCSLSSGFKYFGIRMEYILLVPILFCFPLKSNIYYGQIYLVLFSMLVEGYIAYDKKNLPLASIFWSICIFLKVFPVLMVLFLLAKKDVKAVLYLGVACLLFLATSIMITGLEIWQYYFLEVLPKSNVGEIINGFTENGQSAIILFNKLFEYDALINPYPLISSTYILVAALVLFKSIIIVSCLVITGKDMKHNFVSFSLWIIASLLILPHGSSYSLILLVPAFMAICIYSKDRKKNFPVYILLIFIICQIPIYFFRGFHTIFQFPRLYLILLFYFLLVSQLPAKLDFKITGFVIFIITLTSMSSLKKEVNDNFYILKNDNHLIYDYSIRNGVLIYNYWGEKGESEEVTDISIKKFSKENLTISDNQIFFKGIQMTNCQGLKINPSLINNNEILYLSDHGRGIGFFTLRKIKIE